MKAKQAGFTLVEIAIVLVIIGLLLGGVLKGQELINQARIKNVTNDFNGITAAVYTYQDRYKQLPGDDPAASGRWAGSGSGDGDGAVEAVATNPASTPASNEDGAFWRHLRQAGLIAGDAASPLPPLNAVNGQITVLNATLATDANGLLRLVVCSAGVLGKLAEAVDSQIDDGRPNTGTVRSRANVAAPGLYVDDGSTSYDVCKNI